MSAIGPNEGVLGQVGGELGIAEHAHEVGVDLALVAAEELLDEGARRDRVGGHGRRVRGGGIGECRDLVRLRRRDVATRDHRAPSPAEREIDEHGSSRLPKRRGQIPRSGPLTTGAQGV